jgi:hypothetical protein
LIATVQLIDAGPLDTVRTLVRRPRPGRTPGLRWAEGAVFAPLAAGGPPPVRRAGLIAFWDDEDAFARFEEEDPLGQRYRGGFEARLRPLRAHGAWPGLPEGVPTARNVPHDGPVVVLTLGRLRVSQAIRFLRASRPAEHAAVAHPGFLWGTAAARPPFVATVSIWRSSRDSSTYAYGRQQPAHTLAMNEQERKDFHKESSFIRFAPLRLQGGLSGPNPLDLARVAATAA